MRQPTTFYMFSGPDFLYANAFFPGSATYVMSGLEPVGRLPEMKHITRAHAARRARASARLDGKRPADQLLPHQPDAGAAALRASSTAPCRSSTRSWRGPGKPSPVSSFVKIEPDGSVKPSDGEPVKGVPNGVKIAFTSARRQAADALLLQHRRLQRRHQEQRLPQVLRAAGHRRRVREERVLSHAQRQLLDGARVPAHALRHDPAGRHRRYPCASSSPTTGSCAPSAAISGPSPYSAAAISGSSPTSSARSAPSRSPSASAIAGGPTSRTCCSPCASSAGRRGSLRAPRAGGATRS